MRPVCPYCAFHQLSPAHSGAATPQSLRHGTSTVSSVPIAPLPGCLPRLRRRVERTPEATWFLGTLLTGFSVHGPPSGYRAPLDALVLNGGTSPALGTPHGSDDSRSCRRNLPQNYHRRMGGSGAKNATGTCHPLRVVAPARNAVIRVVCGRGVADRMPSVCA
jgi:hypothetical protein